MSDLKEHFRRAKSVQQNLPIGEVDGGFLPMLPILGIVASALGIPALKEVGTSLGKKLGKKN